MMPWSSKVASTIGTVPCLLGVEFCVLGRPGFFDGPVAA